MAQLSPLLHFSFPLQWGRTSFSSTVSFWCTSYLIQDSLQNMFKAVAQRVCETKLLIEKALWCVLFQAGWAQFPIDNCPLLLCASPLFSAAVHHPSLAIIHWMKTDSSTSIFCICCISVTKNKPTKKTRFPVTWQYCVTLKTRWENPCDPVISSVHLSRDSSLSCNIL